MNILVNLPPAFFRTPALEPIFERLRSLGTLRFSSHNTPEEILPDLRDMDAVIMWAWPLIDETIITAHPRLRFIGFLDVSQAGARAALAKSLPISVSRGGFSPAVSEMALTLTLTALRRVSDYHAQMKASSEPWVADIPVDIDPMERELTGRSVGLIGLGAVGRRLAELLQPFHCTLRVADPFVPEAAVTAAKASRCDLDELLATSEVVVLCAASNSGTRKLIDAQRIALMRPGTVFVNVARAALVDTSALIERLNKGDLIAAVDVFDQEPLAKDHPLRSCPNAYLTPHRAGGLMVSMQRIIDWLIDDLENHLAGRPLRYRVTEAMLPALDA